MRRLTSKRSIPTPSRCVTNMKVFVSATSGDLMNCREAVQQVLLQGGIHPVTQEILSADHRSLPEYLNALVQSCDAVVCLVGKVFGAAPDDAPSRSYTQREYDCALKLKKPIFAFLTNDDFYPDPPKQSLEKATWQEEHYQSLMNEKYCRFFSNQIELEREVGVSIASIWQAAGRVPMHYYHLPLSPPYFVGRAFEKTQLFQAMTKRSPGLIAVIGMAGQGKSTLVDHAIRVYQGEAVFSFQAGFWCTAGLSGFTFDQFLDEALAYLTDNEFEKSDCSKTTERVQKLLGEMQKRPVLIVVDAIERWLQGWQSSDPASDFDYEENRNASVEGLDEFLSQSTGLSNGSHVIITSRALPEILEDIDKIIIPLHETEKGISGLQGLDRNDAIALLKSHDLRATDDYLGQIAEQFDYHPLALNVFGGYVQKRYGGILKEGVGVQTWDRKKILTKLFTEVYERLPRKMASDPFLGVVACTIEEAPLEAIEAVLQLEGLTDEEWAPLDCALSLADWQVLTYHPRIGTVGMHALLKDFFKKQLTASQQEDFHRHFAQWYFQQPISESPKTLEQMKPRLLAFHHSLQAKDLLLCEEIIWGSVTPLFSLVEWMGAFGHLHYGVQMLDRFVDKASDQLLAKIRIARAALLRPTGDHLLAWKDLSEAISLLETQFKEDPLATVADLAGALSNRGTVNLELIRYPESLEDFNRAVSLLESHQGEAFRIQLASIYSNRAMVLRENGQLTAAINDCSCAIAIHEDLFEPVYRQLNAELASAYYNRGNAYLDLHLDEEALQDYTKAIQIHTNLAIVDQSPTPGSLTRGKVLSATVLIRRGQYLEALDNLDQAIDTYDHLIRTGKKQYQSKFAFAKMIHAWCLNAMGDLDDALNECEEVCGIYRRLLDSDLRFYQGPYAHSLMVHAIVLDQTGDHTNAEAYWQTAIGKTLQLIKEGETDLRLLIVRYSIERALLLIHKYSTRAIQLVQNALELVEMAIQTEASTEGLIAEARHAFSRLEGNVKFNEISFDWTRID